MSRRVYLLGVAITLVALALAFTDWALGLQPGATEANVRRVKAGMAPAEVEALLGGPPGGWTMESWADDVSLRWPDPGVWTWDGAAGEARVRLTAAGRVESARWLPHTRRPGPFSRVGAWLRW